MPPKPALGLVLQIPCILRPIFRTFTFATTYSGGSSRGFLPSPPFPPLECPCGRASSIFGLSHRKLLRLEVNRVFEITIDKTSGVNMLILVGTRNHDCLQRLGEGWQEDISQGVSDRALEGESGVCYYK